MPLSVECCGNLLRLQCCLQNSSAVNGIDRCALAWKGVKRWCQKSLVTLIAEMHTRFDQLNGGSVGFGC